MKGYVYRFFIGEDVVYVGSTTNMKARMTTHFAKTTYYETHQIPREEWDNISRVEYVEMGSQSDMKVLEAYLIALWKPRFNKAFADKDELTLKMDISWIKWREWKLTINDDPTQHILVWKDDVLLYEIPKVGTVYTCLCMKLGITLDMNFGYCTPVYDNGYKLMRLSGNHGTKTGKMKQRPKYSFMGYPELWQEAV